MASELDRWRQDPCAFICEVLVNLETGMAELAEKQPLRSPD
jgi:hypothetical protein